MVYHLCIFCLCFLKFLIPVSYTHLDVYKRQVEVISDEILGRGLKEAAAYTYENTEKVLKEAWPEMVD